MSTFHIGLALPVAKFNELVRLQALATLAEDLGVDALYLQERQGQVLDPYVVLAELAQRLPRLVLGVLQPLDGKRAPSVLAKTLSGLDLCSKGRGAIALGDLDDQNDNVGLGISEALTVLEAMLHNDETTFTGEYFAVDRAWNTPRLSLEHPPFVQLASILSASQWRSVLHGPPPLFGLSRLFGGHVLCEFSDTSANEVGDAVSTLRDQCGFTSVIGTCVADGLDGVIEQLRIFADHDCSAALCRWKVVPSDDELRDLVRAARAEFS